MTTTFSLTSEDDTIVAPASGSTVYATSATLTSGDQLTGSIGTDVLALIGSGTFRVDQLASFTGFERIELNNATNTYASLTLGSQPIRVDTTGYLQLNVTSPSNWNGSNIVNGDSSSQSTILYFYNPNSSSVTYDLTSNAFSNVRIGGAGDNITFAINNSDTVGVGSYFSGGQNNKLVTGGSTLDLSHSTVSGFRVISTNGVGTTFTIADLGSAFQIDGGSGNDTLIAQGLSLTSGQRTAIFGISSIETITDQTGTYSAPSGTLKLTADADVIVAPASGSTVYATSATLTSGDQLTGSIGTDVLALIGSGTFRVDQLASFTGFERIELNNATNTYASLTLGSQPIRVDTTGYLQLNVTSPSNWNGSNIVNGDSSSQSTILYFYNPNSSSVTYDLTSNAFSNVRIGGAGDNITFAINNSDTVGVGSYFSGGQNNKLVTGGSTLDLSHSTVSGFRVISTNGVGTTFTIADLGSAFQIDGGSGNDTLIAQGLSLTAGQRASIFGTTSIETIIDQTGTYSTYPNLTEYVAVSNTAVFAGASFTVDTYTMNLGSISAPGSTAGIYLSTDATITTSDTLIATVTSPGLTPVSTTGYYDLKSVAVSLASNLAPGTYYIGGIADYADAIAESKETDNSYNAVKITVTAPAQPDLVEYVGVGSTTVAAGGNLTVDAYAMNIGNAASGASTAKIYLSTDATITLSDTLLASVNSGALTSVGQAGYYDHQTLSVALASNLAPGTYYIGGIADDGNQVNEANEGNNTYNVTQITVTAPAQPDLAEYVGVGNTTVAAGGNLTVDAYAMNIGNAASGASTAKIYLSTDATITSSDTLLASVSSGVLTSVGQAGYYDHQTLSVALASDLAPGTYYIGGIADDGNQVNEANEGNNTYNVTQITVTAPAQPDLAEYVGVGNTTVAAGGNLTVDAYAMNIGNAASGASTAKIYLSTDATITSSDTLLASVNSGALTSVGQAGYYDHQTLSVALASNLAPGTYYIGGIADDGNQVNEANEGNNTYNVTQITVTAPAQPDLAEYVGVGNTTVAAGGNLTVDAYAMNIGNAASGASTAKIYLSTDATITSSDTLLASVNSGALTSVGQAGYYDHQTLSVALASNLAPGTYYIGGIADDGNQVNEANEGNNTYNVTQITVTSSAAFSLAAGQDHSDTFVFKPGFGNVTITDFDLASDIIEIEHTIFANAEALFAAAFEDGNGSVVIAATSTDTITIDNVGLAELLQHQADFHFV